MGSQELYVEGCHSSVFILSSGALTDCSGWSGQCIQVYMQQCQKCISGLANTHIAIVADPTLISKHKVDVQIGVWSPVRQLVYRTPRPARRRWGKGKGKKRRPLSPSPPPADIHYNYSLLEEFIALLNTVPALESSSEVSESEQTTSHSSRQWDVIAGQLHALLDDPPWTPEENSIIDVHWLLGKTPVPSLSLAPSLSGALLRLKMWHNMNLQLLVNCNNILSDTTTSSSREWFDAFDAKVVTLDTWRCGLQDIWRGNIHFTENRTTKKQACRQTVVFSGFSLSLQPLSHLTDSQTNDVIEPHNDVIASSSTSPHTDDVTKLSHDVITSSSAALLQGVGLPEESATPTHLEVVQILNTSTIPFVYISPLHCTLSLNDIRFRDSASLFTKIFTRQDMGMLVRLCYSEQDNNKTPSKHRTTADWNKHIQSIDENEFCNSSSHSPLAAYEGGPLLAVYQPNHGETSCDAWFLWKQEAINPSPFLNIQTIKPADQDTTTTKDQPLNLTLPLIRITDSHTATIDGKFVFDDLSSTDTEDDFNGIISYKHVLDVPPSEWQEIKALETYEWIQRKLVRRLTTRDLMFGQMVAPPPSSSSSSAVAKICVNADDVLECFHDTGSPATSDLSPITNDVSDIVKVLDPSGSNVPSFESIAADTPRSKKQYHGVNYCLQPEDSLLDARLTRIQQRYLLSERASNCSSSNTPEVKLEQRRQRRLKRADIRSVQERTTRSGGEKGRRKLTEGSVGIVTGGVERLELTAREEEGNEKHRGGRGGRRSVQRGEHKGERGGSECGMISDSDQVGVKLKEKESLILCQPLDLSPTNTSTTSKCIDGDRMAESNVRFNKSPVVKLHKVQTPPSTQSKNLLNQLKPSSADSEYHHQYHHQVDQKEEKDRLKLYLSHDQQCTSSIQTMESAGVQCKPTAQSGPKLCRSPRKKIELTLNDATLTSSSVTECSSLCKSDIKLRRSPRKNKWTSSKKPPSGDKDKSSKKKLEQIVVASLKKNGMQRDHALFRKCYNRLFNLSKSFLKDLRNSRTLVSEMHRVVDFNVSQVIDFELRQANTTL